ncbi:MAG: helix-turn-helix domain-containing protein [Armatimonadetes bacterium]|nr:helix-turn-helix domain-containing protein [Armatimonadota bacterium]
MECRLGDYLRQLRTERKVSLNRLALKAGVTKSTLIRWESGAHRPRLPELDSVLTALDASPDQRERAYAFLDVPRARSGLDEKAEALPTVGDLLRAMRLRRGMSLEGVAASIGVHTSTVSRWEGGQVTLPLELREPLLDLFRARPTEREAMRERRWTFGSPVETGVPLEELHIRLQHLYRETLEGNHVLMDLEFLTFRSQVWPLLSRRDEARHLLAMGYFVYALGLSWVDRRQEASRHAERALEMLSPTASPEDRINVVTVAALMTAKSNSPQGPARAVERLRGVLPLATTPQLATGLYRDMADYAHRGGYTEAALDYIQKAYVTAEQAEDPNAHRLARFVHAEILLEAGQPRTALPLLYETPPPFPLQTILEALQWGEALFALGDRTEAYSWALHAGELLDTYDYPHLLEPWKELIRKF